MVHTNLFNNSHVKATFRASLYNKIILVYYKTINILIPKRLLVVGHSFCSK